MGLMASIGTEILHTYYKTGYIQAIDDFFEKIMEYCSMSNMNRTMIRQIAEQLKAGGVDG